MELKLADDSFSSSILLVKPFMYSLLSAIGWYVNMFILIMIETNVPHVVSK